MMGDQIPVRICARVHKGTLADPCTTDDAWNVFVKASAATIVVLSSWVRESTANDTSTLDLLVDASATTLVLMWWVCESMDDNSSTLDLFVDASATSFVVLS